MRAETFSKALRGPDAIKDVEMIAGDGGVLLGCKTRTIITREKMAGANEVEPKKKQTEQKS